MDEILIVDSDQRAKAAAEALDNAGYRAEVTADGELALSRLQTGRAPGLIMLEMDLPGLRGPEVLRRIRRTEATRALPVIALSNKGDEIDRVLAFELGADDFIKKPFSLRELVLRVRAVLRRVEASPVWLTRRRVSAGPVHVDTESRQVLVAGKPVNLTTMELRLLCDLAERIGQVQTRAELLERVWPSPHVGIRTVDTHIRRLREKLGSSSHFIETVRGVGYRMRTEAPNRHNADT